MHTAAHYEESGGRLTVSVGEGAQRPSLTLSLAPASTGDSNQRSWCGDHDVSLSGIHHSGPPDM